MMENYKQVLLDQLADSVLKMEDEVVKEVAEQYVAAGYDGYDGITQGLARGITQAGALFEEGEYYIPELLLCSDAMYNGIEILKPTIPIQEKSQYVAVIGVIEGDTHDIGKNLVKIMLEAEGFKVYDLGKDVTAKDFIEKTAEVGANLVGLSTLMTSTMDRMKEVIELFETRKLRDQVSIVIGGGPISNHYAQQIGADGYSEDASKGARLAKQLVDEKLQLQMA